MIIAIDGTAASGKGTLGRRLASALELDYLDTGQLYRAVGFEARARYEEIDGLSEEEARHLAEQLDLSTEYGEAIRTNEVAEAASKMAALPAVRQALLERQRLFAHHPPSSKGAILDGRDIGTVVLPDADAKFYVDAAADIRANRRFLELQEAGIDTQFSDVLSDIIQRDCRDKNRTVAPLIAAEDAFFIDSSDQNADEVVQIALDHLKSRGLTA